MEDYLPDESDHDENPLEARLKSRSLPSYAKPGGEGLDYRAIFAVLEKEELRLRKRRPSFRKREGGKPNYFCFPLLSAKARCKETSLSSDTSCSSLEFHRPRSREILLRSWQKKEENVEKERASPKIPESNSKVKKPIERLLLPPDPAGGSTMGSTDSLEKSVATGRSSRTSSDSMSKKEKIDAVKARVEAAREKYRDSSSEEELFNKLPHHSSTELLHRSHKDVRSRSARTERYLRRKSQEETVLKRAFRCSEQTNIAKSEESTGKPPVGCIKLTKGNDIDVSFRKETPAKITGINVQEGGLFPCSRVESTKDFGQYLRKDYCDSIYQPMEGSYNCRETHHWKTPHVNSLPTASKSHILPSRQTIPLVQKTKSFHEAKSPDTKYHMLTVATAAPSATEGNFRGILHPRPSPRDSGISSMASTSSVTRAPTPPPRSPHSKTVVNEAFQQMRNVSSPTFRASPWPESHSLERRRGIVNNGSPRSSMHFNSNNCDNKTYHRLVVGGETVSANGSDGSQRSQKHVLNDPWTDSSQHAFTHNRDRQSFPYFDVSNSHYSGDRLFPMEKSSGSISNGNDDFDTFLAQLSASRDHSKNYSSGAYMSDSQINPERNGRYWRNYCDDTSNGNEDTYAKWRCLPRRKPLLSHASTKCAPHPFGKEEAPCVSESLVGFLKPHVNPLQQTSERALYSSTAQNSPSKQGIIGQRFSEVDSNPSLSDWRGRNEAFERKRLLNSPTQVPKRLSTFRSFADDNGESHILKSKDEREMTLQEREKRCSDSLEHAMAELEKVYRSLRLSDDDILGKNEVNNPASLSSSAAKSSDVLNPFSISKSSSSSDSLSLSPPVKITNYPSYRIPTVSLKPSCTNNLTDSQRLHIPKIASVKDKISTKRTLPVKLIDTQEQTNFSLEKHKKIDSNRLQPNSSLNIEELFKDLTQSVQMEFENSVAGQAKERNSSSRVHPFEFSTLLKDEAPPTIPSQTLDAPLHEAGLKRSNSQHSDKENIPGDVQQAKDGNINKGHWLGGRKRRAVRSHSANFAHLLKADDAKDMMVEIEKAQSMTDIIAALERDSGVDMRNKRKGSLNTTALCANKNEKQKYLYELTKTNSGGVSSKYGDAKYPDRKAEITGKSASPSVCQQTAERSAEIWQVAVSIRHKSKPTASGKERKPQVQLHNALMRSKSSPPMRLRTPRRPDTWSDTEVRPNKVTPLDEGQLDELLLSLDREAKALTRGAPATNRQRESRTSLLSGSVTDSHVGSLEGEMHGVKARA